MNRKNPNAAINDPAYAEIRKAVRNTGRQPFEAKQVIVAIVGLVTLALIVGFSCTRTGQLMWSLLMEVAHNLVFGMR